MNIVVAACKNRGIGINNTLPWNLSKDLKYFKFLTRCHGKNAIVMGKNTCLSLQSFIDSDMINSIYYTDIDTHFDCDTYFPKIPKRFKRVFISDKFNENDINYNMKVYVKEGLNPDKYINKAKRALHFTNTTLG